MSGVGTSIAATLLRFVRTVMLGLAVLIAAIVGAQYFMGFDINPGIFKGLALLMGIGVTAGATARLFDPQDRGR